MSPILDHISLGVRDIAAAAKFYDAALAALGLSRIWEKPGAVAWGLEGADDFGVTEDHDAPRRGTHLAFRAQDRAAVDRFHAAALAHGGRDDGAPGLRPQYHATYYAAYVRDPDGNRVEAVCHDPAGASSDAG